MIGTVSLSTNIGCVYNITASDFQKKKIIKHLAHKPKRPGDNV